MDNCPIVIMISFSSIFKIVAVVCGVEIGINKVGHLCCRICVGIEVSNLLRILLSKVTNEVSKLAIEFASDVDWIRVPTVDDQPYSDARSLNWKFDAMQSMLLGCCWLLLLFFCLNKKMITAILIEIFSNLNFWFEQSSAAAAGCWG